MAPDAFAQQAAFAQSQRNGLMWMGQSALSPAHAQSARNGWMGQFLWHEPRIQSRRSVSEADFPAYWAAHWKAEEAPKQSPEWFEGYRAARLGLAPRANCPYPILTASARDWLHGHDYVMEEDRPILRAGPPRVAPPPDSIPGALAAARARMGALTGERA